MKKILLLPILATLFSCSTEALTDNNLVVEASNTDKCTLTWVGSGELMLIDKSQTLPDTILKTNVNGIKNINLAANNIFNFSDYTLSINGEINGTGTFSTNSNSSLITCW